MMTTTMTTEEDEIKMKKWVTQTIRIMPRLAQDHRDPHLEAAAVVVEIICEECVAIRET